ncbi:nuclear transport factor 2 family protein [Saccharothrix saharensis]|uniref:nuclear transport factor 2 family protein n=1 Tax=Saccharothrix saharensis TaxID=571190 RepID=UPI0036CB242C
MQAVPGSGAGFVPTDEDVAGVLAWFEQWDALAVAKDVEAMADMALFPVNAVTDGSAQSWDRARFLHDMAATLGDGDGDVRMESVRTPVFVNANLVFVITDATITAGEFSQVVRYGDLLVKADGKWLFQTMVQGGW